MVIAIPPPYLDHIRHAQEKIEETKHRVVSLLSEHSPDAMQADSSGNDDDDQRELTEKILTSSAISKRFMVCSLCSNGYVNMYLNYENYVWGML
jgi:hypothetical protein